MGSNYDIEMSSDDTLELDTIIKESNIASDPINDLTYYGDSSYNENILKNFETHTTVFDPPEPGEYDIKVNGQVLSINVTDASTIPDSVIYDYEDGDSSGWSSRNGDSMTAVQTTNSGASPPEGSYCGELYADGANADNFYTLSESITPKNLIIYLRIEQNTAGGNPLNNNWSSGGVNNKIVLSTSINSGNDGVQINTTITDVSVQNNRWYEIKFLDIDWSNNEVSSVVIDGNEEIQNLSFRNNASSIDTVRVNAREGGETYYGYNDYIAYDS